MQFVIRDHRFGLALREAESAEFALLSFVADRLAADGRAAACSITSNREGTEATTRCMGTKFTAHAVRS